MYNEILLSNELDLQFGRNRLERIEKLKEEAAELEDACREYMMTPSPTSHEHLIDEMSDVAALLMHVGGIIGVSMDALYHNAYDKVVHRKADPNYKRIHPHGSETTAEV